MDKNKEFILQLLTEKEYRYLEILNHPHFVNNPSLPKRLVKELVSANLIRPTYPGQIKIEDNPLLKLGASGWTLVNEIEEEHHQQAKTERQQRFQNKVSVASVLVPFVTFLLGLIIEHWVGVVQLALSFFK